MTNAPFFDQTDEHDVVSSSLSSLSSNLTLLLGALAGLFPF